MASGHLEKRSEKSWAIVIECGKDPLTGKRKRLKKAFRGNKRDAEKELARLLMEIEQGFYIEPSKLTTSEYLKKWHEDYCKNKLASSTCENYWIILDKHLIPALGAIPLSKLKPLHIQDYYAKALSKGLSLRSVQYHHAILRKALQQAVKWKLIPYNPADGAESPRPQRKEQNVLPAEKVNEFLERISGDPFYPLIYTALWTGMRRGELLGLRWRDVDLKGKSINVVQSLRWVAGECRFEDVKTEKSRRNIPIPDALVTFLKKLRKEQAEIKLRQENYQDYGLVFCRPDGAPWCPSTITHHFHDLAKNAGFPDLRFHDLRHTHATLLLKQGVHPKVVQERLGHASITTTMDIYSHVLPTLQKQAIEQLGTVIGTSHNNTK